MAYKVGTFDKTTGGAPVSQTVDTGLGSDLGMVMVWSEGAASTGFTATVRFTLGFAVAAGATAGQDTAFSGPDNVVGNGDIRHGRQQKLVTFNNHSGGVQARGALETLGTGVDSGKFEIDWEVNDSIAAKMYYLAMTDDLLTQKKVGTFSLTTGTGTLDVTGAGWNPANGDLLILIASGFALGTGVDAEFSIGFASVTARQGVSSLHWRQGESMSSRTIGNQETDEVIHAWKRSGNPTQTLQAQFNGWITDGFQINKVSNTSAAFDVGYMLLRGPKFEVGSFISDTSTGTQPVPTDVKPGAVWLQGIGQGADPAPPSSLAQYACGAASASSEQAAVWVEADSVATTYRLDRRNVTTALYADCTRTSTVDMEMDLDSFNIPPDFTVDITQAKTPGNEVLFIAMGEALSPDDRHSPRRVNQRGLRRPQRTLA